MAKRYLGYGYTNAQGVAKLEYDAEGNELTHSYTGIGAGKIDIVAESGGLQSETYEIMDAIVLDRATSSDYTNLFTSMTGITRNATDSTAYLDRSSSSSASNKQTASYALNGGLGVQITLTSIDHIYMFRVSLETNDGTVIRSISAENLTVGTVRFECKPNNTKIYMDDTLVLDEDENNTSSLTFQIRTAGSTTDIFNFKNLMIFPV